MKKTKHIKKEVQMKMRKVKKKVSAIIDTSTFAGSIEVFSNTQAAVDGCNAILEYDESCIKLQCPKLCVSFKGEGLYIKTMTDSSAVIYGTIASIDFCTN